MELNITDLKEFSDRKAKFVKLGEYKINVTDIPVKIALKINDYQNKVITGEKVETVELLNDIVYPIIQKQYSQLKKENIEEVFNYDQLLKIFNEIWDAFINAGSVKDNGEDNTKKNEKK